MQLDSCCDSLLSQRLHHRYIASVVASGLLGILEAVFWNNSGAVSLNCSMDVAVFMKCSRLEQL